MIEPSEEQKILLDNLKRAVKEKIAPVAAETDRKGTFNWDIASMPIRFFPKTVDWESRYSRHALVEKHRQNFRHGRVGTIPATFGLFINVSHPIARYRQHHGVGMLLWEATG